MPELELDYMEYATDALAQAAYVSNGGFLSIYPTHDDAHVKATTKYNANAWPYYATDPTKSLIGAWDSNEWFAGDGVHALQRFHIDLGAAYKIRRIYYENGHSSGGYSTTGINNFTLWGSNTYGDFSDLVYANNGTWVQLTLASSVMAQHPASDIADPHYILVDNDVAYRYYGFKFADNHGDGSYMMLRRVELQSGYLLPYSEGTIKSQGSYSLRAHAEATGSLNKTLTRTVSPVINLSDKTIVRFYMRSSRTGSNIKIGIHDSGGVNTEVTPNIITADTFQTCLLDLSGVANADKDAINQIIVTVINADADNDFYIDNLFSSILTNYLTHRGRNRFKFSGISLG